jgi:long-chain acyl-CoA synthetase
LSETHTMDTGMPPDAIRWGTQGKPVPGVSIRIIDPDTGAELPVGETGEIVLRSRATSRATGTSPKPPPRRCATAGCTPATWAASTTDGYLTFMGRFKEMIKVSGYSVFPEEVETILIRHPAVAQAAVIGVPDAEKGEVVKAFIVLKPGASPGRPTRSSPGAATTWPPTRRRASALHRRAARHRRGQGAAPLLKDQG